MMEIILGPVQFLDGKDKLRRHLRPFGENCIIRGNANSALEKLKVDSGNRFRLFVHQ